MLKSSIGILGLLTAMPAFAVTPIDLEQHSATSLAAKVSASSHITFVETSRAADFNNTLHIRLQQTINGVPVLGGDAIAHIPQAGSDKRGFAALMKSNSTMNGTVYDNWQIDLTAQPDHVYSEKQKQAAVAQAIEQYQSHLAGMVKPSDVDAKEVIFVDEQQIAHYAYRVSFLAQLNSTSLPEKPTFIIDAVNLQLFRQWNDMKSAENVLGGGFGGNHKTGKKEFDGLQGHLPAFNIQRDAKTTTCSMRNDTMGVIDTNSNATVTFSCKEIAPEHNNVYWNGSFDKIETTWSPSNDAMFGGQVTWNMFRDWYNMPALTKNGKPMFLRMVVHDSMENAYWNGGEVVFGNSVGSDEFNPFTQLDTVGHEICHGFTEQHSDLAYYSQSGGLNEAFSDMAGIAAEYYIYGETKFLVGVGDVKAENEALRYMDKPSKDCKGRSPGSNCSIDTIKQYKDGLNVHYSSGIFNRVYYNLANTPGWDARKAFDVMVKANMNYWTSNTTFAKAACGVMKATKDYGYDQQAVVKAFAVVGIDTKKCGK